MTGQGLSMKMTDLQDLYTEQLQDVYSAENQLLEALGQMAQAASSPDLREGFELHAEQTREQIGRLEQILGRLGTQPGGVTCKAMQGLVAEAREMVEKQADPAVRDAGLIAAAQRAEHYEIAAYGTLRTYAELLGRTEDAPLLQTSEDEEKATDLKLTGLARSINMQALG
ncbi:ferritin-like metal-binding protein YciE [Deinococcus sp. HSC-46F16]|uniref:YciE/YciF ferroxidase family protein n=1 Tax=Deinococcus sp. HSC-46F16 TaxID=2910968 RepID=UPI00209E5EAB|nr:ferritin-like domain-containing protein [Deinococcus sp. HSC-46F16]MCP2013658.1 ferritin-like metal-binding protein YciE [Deinococcus sp. HSC-46F16]